MSYNQTFSSEAQQTHRRQATLTLSTILVPINAGQTIPGVQHGFTSAFSSPDTLASYDIVLARLSQARDCTYWSESTYGGGRGGGEAGGGGWLSIIQPKFVCTASAVHSQPTARLPGSGLGFRSQPRTRRGADIQ